jgi:hypothetical protein
MEPICRERGEDGMRGGGMLMLTHEYVHQMFQLYLVTSVIVPFNSTPLEHLQQHCRNFFPKAYL